MTEAQLKVLLEHLEGLRNQLSTFMTTVECELEAQARREAKGQP